MVASSMLWLAVFPATDWQPRRAAARAAAMSTMGHSSSSHELDALLSPRGETLTPWVCQKHIPAGHTASMAPPLDQETQVQCQSRSPDSRIPGHQPVDRVGIDVARVTRELATERIRADRSEGCGASGQPDAEESSLCQQVGG
jgi:hypothetical protein